jgi:hypothetical protein
VRGKARSSVALKRWLAMAPLLVGAACGGPQKLGGAGATCFRDDECEPGLICVAPEVDDPNRVCSNDPTPLISEVEGPPPVEMPMGGAAGMAGAAGAMAVAGGGMGAMAGGGAPSAGSAGAPAAGTAGVGGGGGAAGSGGSGGSGGTDTAGSAGTAGSGGTDPEGGAPN